MLKKLFGLGLAGALLGVLLATTLSVPTLTADGLDACWCNDGAPGHGDKQCNLSHDACIAGVEVCLVCCGPPELCLPKVE
jgi:hypothetical protein